MRSKSKKAAAASGGAVAAAAEEPDEEEGGPAELDPEDLLPRTDISGSITPSLLGMISSSNWKERNAGVDQVRGLGELKCMWQPVTCSSCGVLKLTPTALRCCCIACGIMPPLLAPAACAMCNAGDPAAGRGQPAHPAQRGGALPSAQGVHLSLPGVAQQIAYPSQTQPQSGVMCVCQPV